MLLIVVFNVSTLQASDFHLEREPHSVTLQSGNDLVTVEVVGPELARVHLKPDGQTSPRTLVMDPSLQLDGAVAVSSRQAKITLSYRAQT